MNNTNYLTQSGGLPYEGNFIFINKIISTNSCLNFEEPEF